MEIVFALVEELTCWLPQWLRVRIAQRVYARLESRTGVTPVGSDPDEMFRALRAWRSHIIWIASGRRIKPPRGARRSRARLGA